MSEARKSFAVVKTLVPRAGQAPASLDEHASWIDDDMRDYGAEVTDVHLNGAKAERVCTTGVARLDAMIGGWFPGQTHVIAGKTGAGKTSFATHSAMMLALGAQRFDRPPVLFFSLEMTPEDMAARAIAWWTRIPQDAVQMARFRQTLTEEQAEAVSTAHRFASKRIRLVSTTDASITAIREAARQAKATHGVSAVVVDYIGLIEPEAGASRGNREREVAFASRGLKAMAIELDVPVLVLCQLGRAAEKEPEPRLSMLRESGSIEQDASVVLFLWSTDPPTPGVTRFVVAKRRFGTPWVKADVRFDGATGYFEDECEARDEQ